MFLFHTLEPSVLDIPTKAIKYQKRWHMAFTAIYCSRAFSSSPLTKPKRISSPVSSTGNVVIDIVEPHPCFLEIDKSVLTQIVKQKNLDLLKKYDGVEGLALSLKTNLEHGIEGDDDDISRRKKTFGSNTYPRPPAKNLWYFVWEALRDPSILILLVFAALSLGFGIKENGLKEGCMKHKTNISNTLAEVKHIYSRIEEADSDLYKSSSIHQDNIVSLHSLFRVGQKSRNNIESSWPDSFLKVIIVNSSIKAHAFLPHKTIFFPLYDGGSIIIAVFLMLVVSAGSNFRQNKQFVKLSKMSDNIHIDVVRSGRRQQVSIFEIIVGDVVCLKIGDQVPADGLFIEVGHSLTVDDSNMIRESDHVEVDVIQNPFLFSGTKVADGYGRMLVTTTGMNTTWGKVLSTIHNDSNEQTPLQSRLKKLTSSMEKFGLSVAFLVLAVFLIRYFTGIAKYEDGIAEFRGSITKAGDIINSVLGMVANALTIIDVVIPEGLPLAVTLTLAYSMKRMMSDNAMVRKLSACETMGSATTICTDKTGTLTLNEMKVTKFWLGLECVDEGGTSSVAPNIVDLLYQGVGLNTTGAVYKSTSGSEFEFTGSPTEKAILSWAVFELNLDMKGLKQSCETLHVEAFNSTRKRSGILMRKKGENTMNVHWKGAAEMVLAMCTNYYDVLGHIKVMDDVERKKFNQIIESMAASSLRCIAFAHKQVAEKENEGEHTHTNIEENCLTLLGLMGLKDPCRPGVKKAVEECQYARVNVKMITGDNIFTAKAIAIECGILKPNHDNGNGAVVEGVEFRNYTHDEQMEKVDKICVMARCSPADKLLMVKCLKQKGHVVAVTGDGTNDAPALKEADVGLSMGKRGTVLAKESSDIVILDDDFGSIAKALRWGRCAYHNFQKCIQFQLTVNVAALVVNFVAAVSASESPLTSVQLSWVNLIIDTLGALALAAENPTKELMEKPPVGRTESLITNIMWRNLLAQAFYQIVVMLTLQFKGESIFKVSASVNHTMIFNVFVLCQMFNEFNSRKLEKKNVFEGIHKNKLFLVIIGVTIVLQVVMVEFLKKIANTERLNWWQWGVCIGFGSISWPIGWVVKWIPLPEKPFFSYVKWGKLKKLWEYDHFRFLVFDMS